MSDTNNRVQTRSMLLNPEKAPSLIAKWQKLLGKDLEKIEVTYTADGVSVELYGLAEPYRKETNDGNVVPISCTEYKKIKAKVLKPSGSEAITAFKNKYEVRLNKEFPATVNLGSGSDAEITAALDALPFHDRRAMLLSNKQFKSAYPNGFVPAQAGN